MKTTLKFVLPILFIFITNQGYAQEFSGKSNVSNEENVRPIRIGSKLGLPNLIGFNLEYVLPVLDQKLAVSADFSTINSASILEIVSPGAVEELEASYRYLEGGINYYIFKPGSGIYAGIGFSNIKLEGTLYDYFYKSSGDEEEFADGIVDFNQSSFNIKVGAKLGGLFYWRPEIGFAFNGLPNEITAEGTFDDGSKQIDTYGTKVNETIPKGLIFNFGFGFSF